MRCHLIVVLICRSYVISDIEHFVICLLITSVSSLEKCLFRLYAHFKTGYRFLLFSCMNSLSILDITTSSRVNTKEAAQEWSWDWGQPAETECAQDLSDTETLILGLSECLSQFEVEFSISCRVDAFTGYWLSKPARLAMRLSAGRCFCWGSCWRQTFSLGPEGSRSLSSAAGYL